MGQNRPNTTRLQHLARAYTQSSVLFAALDLELFTHVADGIATVEELAPSLGITELNTERLVTVCLAMDLLRTSCRRRTSGWSTPPTSTAIWSRGSAPTPGNG